MRKYLIDVPVKLNIWTRTECQRRQFEVIKKAAPSILILQSDGGRNEKEWAAIKENRRLYDEEVDWECKLIKVYEDENQGMYQMSKNTMKVVWDNVDRCIFLEDDYVPAVSFFRYCAELLEKYKDDQRIGWITGNNVFVEHPGSVPYDYFFTEEGWSIWGSATWRDRAINEIYPLPYDSNDYVKKCLKDNLSSFWYRKVKGYCSGELVDGHIPGGEFYRGVNSVLYHRLSIVPTRNLISNVGVSGAHAHISRRDRKELSFFNQPTFELEFPLKHPEYVIDDKSFGRMYSKKLGHPQTSIGLFWMRVKAAIKLFVSGNLIETIKRKRKRVATEK